MIPHTTLFAQSCPTLCNPMDHSLPESSVHGYSPGKNIGVGCLTLLQESSELRDQTRSPILQADSLSCEPPGKPTQLYSNWIIAPQRCLMFKCPDFIAPYITKGTLKMKLRILTWEDYLDFLFEFNTITSLLMKEPGELQSQRMWCEHISSQWRKCDSSMLLALKAG